DKTLYYAVKNAVAMIDLRDNSLQVLDKNAGLSDVGIRCLGSSPASKMLVICYDNSNVDLYDGRTVFNVPDIYNKQITGNKAVNKVFCDDKYAYLASGIGIFVVDLKKKVIKETWTFKKENQMYEVNDVVILNDTVYAATDYGIFYAKRSHTFINNFANWEQITNINTPNNSLFKQFAVLDNTLYVLKNDTVEIQTDTATIYKEKSAIYVKDNNLWRTADIEIKDDSPDFSCRFIRTSSDRFILGIHGEIQCYQWNPAHSKLEREKTFYWCWGPITALSASDGKTYIIEMAGLRWGITEGGAYLVNIPGPAQDPATAMDWKKSKLAVVHNTTDSWTPTWQTANVSILRGEEDWSSVDRYPEFDYIRDFIDVCIAPYDTSIVYAASYLQGLFEIRNDTVYKVYDYTNSTLGLTTSGGSQVVGIAFDGYNNLWIANRVDTEPLSVMNRNGEWQSFGIPFIGEIGIGAVFADSRDWIWVAYDKERKLAIFNPDRSSGTIKSDYSRWKDLNLSLTEEEGAFTYIYTIAETKDGAIWIGTDRGIKIYYSPSRLMNEPHVAPQSVPVKVIRNGDTLVELVLGSEMVRCITADGGNRKWVGTENTGVFLLSPDGKTEIFHFTKDNSPLPSNTVHNITIDGETGDVYFGTSKGLVSFRYTATDGKEDYENLKIFPNPVRENFNGYISISGLKEDSEVKITDAFGKLVYRTVSNGGTAVWDGRRFDGQKASTGVYFVFVNDVETKQDKKAGKILFVK
ncbi:MAG: T9SS type A sorting domain-containing protein, partial [Lentimicrobiaceae bacterium]|nr:T9SS type A sorting domain-containing protein [Lentimicrobiaceae bacterium]